MFGSTPFVPSPMSKVAPPAHNAFSVSTSATDDPFGMGSFTPASASVLNAKASASDWLFQDLQVFS